MSAGDVSYLLGRAHGIISKVLTKSNLSLLLTSKNLTELRAAFTQTPYDSIIGDLNFETQISEVSRRLKNSYSKHVVNFYNQSSSSSLRSKIQLYSERYNAENLRIILHGLHVGMEQEDIVKRLIPVAGYSFEYYTKLLEKSIQEIIETQKDTSLLRNLRKAFEEFRNTDRFTPIESALDQYVYQILPKVSKYYVTYVNMKNIISLCRCITLNVPAYRYILPTKFTARALNATTISEVLEMYNFPPYQDVFSKYIGQKEAPLHEFEFAVERYLLKKWRRIFRLGSVLESDSIIGFFELKLAEAMDIVRIIVGTNAGFSEQEIRESLLYYSLE
ncbi:MAG: V-type ATPase subunit [Candidatus Thorarchaeota archaeon]